MAHHRLPGADTAWGHTLHNVFLIRDRTLGVASALKSRAPCVPAAIGLLHQAEPMDGVAEACRPACARLCAQAFTPAA